MSRLVISEDPHVVVVGWNRPVQSFFMQEWRRPGDDDPVRSFGNWPGEVRSLRGFARLMRGCGLAHLVSPAVLQWLAEDKAAGGRSPETRVVQHG